MSLGLLVGACSSGASPATTGGSSAPSRSGAPHSAPAKDTFAGSILFGTGAYSRDRGRATLYLQPRGSALARRLKIEIVGRCPGSSEPCANLQGQVMGTLTRARSKIPDTGQSYVLAGAGNVAPLGHVSASGWVQGTGFIARGEEVMRIKLTSSSGSVTVQGRTRPTRGFSSP